MKISQTSQENTCARVSFLTKLQVEACNFIKKKRLWHKCFPVTLPKFSRKYFQGRPPASEKLKAEGVKSGSFL